MNFKERMPVTISAVAVILYALFLIKTRNAYQTGLLEGAQGLVYTAKSMLIFIVIFIVTIVATLILQAIIEVVRTGDEDIDDLEDERDRAFELYSLKTQTLANGLSTLLALVLLWAGYSAVLAIHVIFLGNIGGLVFGEMRKHLLYQGE